MRIGPTALIFCLSSVLDGRSIQFVRSISPRRSAYRVNAKINFPSRTLPRRVGVLGQQRLGSDAGRHAVRMSKPQSAILASLLPPPGRLVSPLRRRICLHWMGGARSIMTSISGFIFVALHDHLALRHSESATDYLGGERPHIMRTLTHALQIACPAFIQVFLYMRAQRYRSEP